MMNLTRNVEHWALPYAVQLGQRAIENLGKRRESRPRHLLFAFCDHFEPLWNGASKAKGDQRVQAWELGYPDLAEAFRDSDGMKPKHSFFFPGEQYEPTFFDRLTRLVEKGLGEIELHLHHDQDTEDNLRRDIKQYLEQYSEHGHLSRDAAGYLRYGFIHGNWCLANAREDGRWCGVDRELPLLFDTGCYGDFTFPSAPDPCQPRIINSIYWPTGDLAQRRAYEQGVHAKVGTRFEDRILIMQGPLALSPRRHKLPLRIESAAITAQDPATASRAKAWAAQNIHVQGRPDWVFVKVHTHGAPETEAESLLGDGGRALHRALQQQFNDGERWRLHYVSAREMYNIARAAMDGCEGNPNEYREYYLKRPAVVEHDA